MSRFGIGLFLLLLGVSAHAEFKPGDIKMGVALDLISAQALDDTEASTTGVRSVELMLTSPIDPYFDGQVSVAAHNEEGEYSLILHEAFVSTSKLIPQSRVRVGRFLLGVGRLNQFHQHDWPFVTAPKVMREFFSPDEPEPQHAEGAFDNGLEYTWLVPTSQFFEITVGATNGYCYGHCHEQVGRPHHPTLYVHPSTFFDLGSQRGLLLGATYLKRKDALATETQLVGVDLTYKKSTGRVQNWLVQTEAYFENQNIGDADRRERIGAYIYPEYGLNERWRLGLRVDGFSQYNLKNDDGKTLDDLDWAVVPNITFKPSEYSTLRFAYMHEVDTTEGSAEVQDRQFQLQFVFIMGAHPAHDF